jgi:GAF domain-containing protein
MSRSSQPADNELAGVGSDVTNRRGALAELDALRRVATLVARRVQPEEVFAVVAEEIARLVAIPLVRVMRYEPDDTATQCAAFSTDRSKFPFGKRSSLEGASVLRLVRETSQAARIDDYSELKGEIAEIARRSGIRSAVGAPIVLAGRLWGAVVASSKEQLPEGTETRLADFTELLATAIENAESREALERLFDEQTALRRLATLVAEGVPPSEIFSAVSDEVGRIISSETAAVVRFEHEPPAIVVVGVGRGVPGIPIGTRSELDDALASTQVYRTGRPARIDERDWASFTGPLHEPGRRESLSSTVASPINVDGRVWGTISVSAKEPLPLGTEERLQKWGELVATAIANAESREALRRLADEQAAIRRVATLVANGVRPEEIFAAVSDEVGRLFGTYSATVMKFDDDPPGVVFVGVSTNMSDAFPLGARWEFKPGMASAEVYRTGRSARSDAQDWSKVEGPVGETHRRLGIVSAVASPIIVEGRLWGAMAVQSQKPLPPDTDERLERFTELVATAIANAESRTGLTRLAEEQAALRRVATLVARGVRADEIFAAVSDEVGRLFGTDSATVVKYDDEGIGIVFVGVASRVSGAFPLGAHWKFQEGMASAEVYRTERSARTGAHLATVEGPIGDIQRRLGIMSSVASPIVVEDRLWGAVAVQSQVDLPLDTEERLEKFTELLATAIANAESRAALTRLAEEQAALRRVATLVAQGVRADELFAAVSDEVGRLVGTDSATVVRYDDDGTGIIFVGVASKISGAFPLGANWKFQEGMASAEVYRTGRPARSGTHLSTVEGPVGETHRDLGIVSAVASPIVVEGRLWGAMAVHGQQPLPPDTDERLEKFTELVATAIANAESRAALGRLAEQQAALRRVATLVAEGVPPAEVFSALSEEVSLLVEAEAAVIGRLEADGRVTVLAVSGTSGDRSILGTQFEPHPETVIAAALKEGRSARKDDYSEASEPARGLGIRSGVGVPIVVGGELWGVVGIGTVRERFPEDTEQRLQEFTELAATAIANADSRAELAASRRRIVAASDEARRRIERDLHDGIQQRLVSLGLELRVAESSMPAELEEARTAIARIAGELNLSVDELREISRGIHPAILSEGGLVPALRTLVRRSAVPVELGGEIEQRLPEPIEVAAYYVVSEALTNVTKYANASQVDVDASARDGRLWLSIRDDGIGGADPTRGSGLLGLTDRVEALGGSIRIHSRPDEGTHISAELPLDLERDKDSDGVPPSPDKS